jgi:hypothetical protein
MSMSGLLAFITTYAKTEKENSQKMIKMGSMYCEILMEFTSLRHSTSHSVTR